VFLGKGNGTFSAQTTFDTGMSSWPQSITAADFNGDGYIDIAVGNYDARNIGVFLGHGDGTFQAQQTSFTGGFYHPIGIIAGDFNSDGRLDVAFPYHQDYNVGLLFGYGNGTLGARKKFAMGNFSQHSHISVGDLNGDGHLDIIGNQNSGFGISVLVGDGNGNFELQIIFSSSPTFTQTSVNVGDFNGDGYQDIVGMDLRYSLYIFLNTGQCHSIKSLQTSTFIN
jgi:hypothetical protein